MAYFLVFLYRVSSFFSVSIRTLNRNHEKFQLNTFHKLLFVKRNIISLLEQNKQFLTTFRDPSLEFIG